MPPLTDLQRRDILLAIAAGRRPQRTRSGVTTLGLGAGRRRTRSVHLADAFGTLTAAGEAYYGETGLARPQAPFDLSQPLISRGGNDYIRTRSGEEALVRSISSNSSVRLTRLGEAFFRGKMIEYEVHVPARLVGTSRNGTPYILRKWLPARKLGIARIFESARLTAAQAGARIRTRVLSELGVRPQGRDHVLLEIYAGEAWTYDRERGNAWKISAVDENDKVDATTRAIDVHMALHQPMAALPPCKALAALPEAPRSCAAQLAFARHILPEAFEYHADKLCVARQLAALLHRSMQEIVEIFSALLEGDEWKQVGLTAQDIHAFCELEGHPFFFMSAGRVLLTYKPPEKQGRAIAVVQFDGHAFVLRHARSLSSWTPGHVAEHDRSKLAQESRTSLPPFAEWLQWDERPRAGTFWCHDLEAVREWFLCSGRNPRVSLRNMVDIGSLTYFCTAAKDGCEKNAGKPDICKIREVPQEADAIQRWLANLCLPNSNRNLEWRGEGLPATAERVFNELMRAERRYPSHDERRRILDAQDFRCYLCGGIFDGSRDRPRDVEWDHVTPLRQTVRGQSQVFAACCSSCHEEKTQLEGRQDRGLLSHFSKHVWENYVQTKRPPPLVFESHKGDDRSELIELDVRRCRANALAKSVYPWPVFSPYDSIVQSTPGILADFSFVDPVPRKRQRSLLQSLPLLGPAWYARPVVEWLLHVSLIAWTDIKLSLQAQAHVPCECLKHVIETMTAAWPEEEGHLCKFSINAMLGLWCAPADFSYHVQTSTHSSDAPGFHLKRVVCYGEGQSTNDYVYRTRLLTNRTMRPIHDWVMATEAVRVSQLIFIVQRLGVPPRAIRCVKTDCIVMQAARKTHKDLCAVAELTHKDLPTLVQKYMRVEEGQTRLNCPLPAMTQGGDDTLVFRHSQGAGVKFLQGHHCEPCMSMERPSLVPEWTDLDENAALEAARTTGLLCVGAPGVGKSTWARELVANLRKEGKVVHIVAKTHLACKNFGLGCQTADHWCIRFVQNGDCRGVSYVVVEELTQINVQLWSSLALAKMRGCVLICLGDFGQFTSVAETWAGSPVAPDSLRDSAMLRELCGSNRFTLTENKRSNPRLFAFVTSLHPGTAEARPLDAALAEARVLFPVTERPAQWQLVLSHRKRMFQNRLVNQTRKSKDACFFRFRQTGVQLTGNQPQSMWLWTGVTLVGAGGPCPRGVLLEVTSVTPDEVALSNGATLLAEQVCRVTRLAHCLCYASVQGLTLPGVVRLSDTGSPMYTLRHLYVGSSRATAAAFVEVE